LQNDDAKYNFPAFICSLWPERQRTSKPVAFNGIPTVVLPEKTGLRNPRARFREADGDSWLPDEIPWDCKFGIFPEAPATTTRQSAASCACALIRTSRCVLGIMLANTPQDSASTMLCKGVKVRTENTDFLRAGANPVGNPVSLASILAQCMRWCDNEDFKGLAVDLLSPLARLILKSASKWCIMVRQRLENQ
jgi:hypothetical protein